MLEPTDKEKTKYRVGWVQELNLLSANPTKWSKTLKLRRSVNVFKHFVGLWLKELKKYRNVISKSSQKDILGRIPFLSTVLLKNDSFSGVFVEISQSFCKIHGKSCFWKVYLQNSLCSHRNDVKIHCKSYAQ